MHWNLGANFVKVGVKRISVSFKAYLSRLGHGSGTF
jgi:hypothetical protein